MFGQQQQFGLVDEQPNQQPLQWPARHQVNIIGNADEEQEMIVDQQNNLIQSESNNQILQFSPPKQNQ
jgi:hypothetical protein